MSLMEPYPEPDQGAHKILNFNILRKLLVSSCLPTALWGRGVVGGVMGCVGQGLL